MRKYQTFVTVLTLILLAVVLTGGVSQAQGPKGDDPAVYWPSSDPVPEGVRVMSPPDRPNRVDPLDDEPSQTYNASVRIAGSALKPRESNVEWSGVSGAGGCIYASSGNTIAVFSLPVYLPDDATIRYFRMYYNDLHETNNCQAWLTVYDLYGVVVEEWSVTSTGDTGKDHATTSYLSHEVDYTQYSYVINWRPNELGPDMQACGFRIYYYDPYFTFLPSVMKNYN